MSGAAHRLLAYEGRLIALLLAFSFIARGPLIALPFGGVALLWGARWAGEGRPWRATPFNGPLAVLLGFSALALWPSVDPVLSLTRLGNLLLGVALVQAILAGGAAVSWRNLCAGLLAVNWLLLPLVVAGTDWADKASLIGAGGYAWLPHWLPNIFTNSYGQAQAGVQPNQLAALLAILLPIAIMLLRTPPPATALAAPPATRNRAGRLVERLVAGLLHRRALIALVGLTVGAIALTQSRGALVGLILSQGLLWGWPSRRRLLPLVGVVAGGAALLVALVPSWRATLGALFLPAGPQHYLSNTLAIRVELWQRAVRMICDYPFTGIGLNTFPKIQPPLYPLFSFAPGTYDLPTAHNYYLQAALDYGIPGALALAAVLI
ncbi:MAG: O-antigen ligase family protein, partial [Chloroflexota bacterium]|nr:O-antigen ligase family protein [Chloroflexota bacterium]